MIDCLIMLLLGNITATSSSSSSPSSPLEIRGQFFSNLCIHDKLFSNGSGPEGNCTSKC